MPVRVVVLVVAGWVTSVPVWPHHSHTNYDMTEYHHLAGTVRDIHWINPHIWLYVRSDRE